MTSRIIEWDAAVSDRRARTVRFKLIISRLASILLLGTAAVLMETASNVALAQKPDAWPSRPIRLIVPFPPGGGTDLVGRSVGNKLAEALGQRIVIDNRGGAGGTIGAELAVRSDPDGYTMFIGNIGAIAINPSLYAGKLSYDPQRDLAPVTLSSDALNILMVHPALPAKSVKELIALARARPDQLSFSSSGPGATDHLAGELFNRMAGVRTIHVPYKGGGPAAIDLAAGNVQFSFNTASAQVGMWKAGRLRALAVLSPKRQPLFPELPSIAETVPGPRSTTVPLDGCPRAEEASTTANRTTTVREATTNAACIVLAPYGTAIDILSIAHPCGVVQD